MTRASVPPRPALVALVLSQTFLLCASWAPVYAPRALRPHTRAPLTLMAGSLVFAAEGAYESERFTAQAGNLTAWFDSPDTLTTIFASATSVTDLGSNTFEAVVPMSNFPGITVTTTTQFTVTKFLEENLPSLRIDVIDSTSTATGPDRLVKIFNASQASPPRTSSSNVVSVEQIGDDLCVRARASVELEMDIPNWVERLMPKRIFERAGSKSMKGVLDGDVQPCVGNLREQYLSWSGESA